MQSPTGRHSDLRRRLRTRVHHVRRLARPYKLEIISGKADDKLAVFWLYRREAGDGKPITAQVQIPNLAAGTYQVTWWDTLEGKPVAQQSLTISAGGSAQLTTPPITQDLALYLRRDTK